MGEANNPTEDEERINTKYIERKRTQNKESENIIYWLCLHMFHLCLLSLG
jgi:hypothetical protein